MWRCVCFWDEDVCSVCVLGVLPPWKMLRSCFWRLVILGFAVCVVWFLFLKSVGWVSSVWGVWVFVCRESNLLTFMFWNKRLGEKFRWCRFQTSDSKNICLLLTSSLYCDMWFYFIIFLCSSIYRWYKVGPQRTDIHEIWYCHILRKTVKKVKVSLRYDNNNRWFT